MLEIGSLVDGKYKILSEIGHGGMSVVYMAINEKANKTWAVKEVRKNGVLDFESVRQGLIVETNMLKKLKHNNLPSIIDVIENDDSFLIVMDYIEGNSLADILLEEGAQPQEYVIEWAKQLCDVLGYLHSRTPSIIYRDMKPANIMLKPDGKITLIDFGTAREYKEKNIADTTCLGTVGYAAPEQFGGMGQTDARTDIYCLGTTLYHLLTGYNPSEPPYEILPIRDINPALSSGLEAIIIKCTQRNPDDRYQSCAELAYALEHYDTYDDEYKQKQKQKLGVFVTFLLATIIFLAAGISTQYTANVMAKDNYDSMITQAKREYESENYGPSADLYKECTTIPGKAGDSAAYLGLIEVYKTSDGKFDKNERESLLNLIKTNEEELKQDMDGYVSICYETGRLHWFFYDTGEQGENPNTSQVTRMKSSIEWFKNVVDNVTEDYPNYKMADAYATIGSFYRDIQIKVDEAENTKGSYKPYFDKINELVDTTCSDDSEREIVKVQLLEFARYSLQTYTTKFKGDDITLEEQLQLLQKVREYLEEMNESDEASGSDRAVEIMEESMAQLDATEAKIRGAYQKVTKGAEEK